jgi:hypothetical protein
MQISQLKQHPLGKTDQIALWIQAPLFTFLAVLAVFGLIGAVTKNRSMISGFAIALAIHLVFSIASGVFSIVMLFARQSQALDSCIQNAGDSSDAAVQSCKTGLVLTKGVMIAVFVLIWLIQLYAYVVVSRYVDQLDEELMANTVVVPRTMTMAGGPQVTTYTTPTYPFVDQRQAFGATRGMA